MVWISNILLCITYKTLGNCILALTQVLETSKKLSEKKDKHICTVYQRIHMLIQRLDLIMSRSLLVQEGTLLFGITLSLIAGQKTARIHSVLISAYFYQLSLTFSLVTVLQFHPMVMLNLNSKKFLRMLSSRVVPTKYSRLIVQRLRVIKVRPMGVHTITLYTLSDYVIFIVSFLLMLLQI